MHIAVLVDSYYPNLSMNGVITSNIVQELLDKNDVTIVTYKSFYNESNYEYYNGLNIYRILNHNVCIGNFIKKLSINKGSTVSNILKSVYFVKRVIFNLKRNIHLLGLDFGVIKKLGRQLHEIHRNKKIDLLITVTAPYEMAYTGLEFIRIADTNYMPIKLDFYSELDDDYYPNFLKKHRKIRRISLEKQVLQECKTLFALEYLKPSFAKVDYQNYNNKIVYINHPLIKENKCFINKEEIVKGNEISIVYTGTLSKRERNPKDILEILLNTSKNFKYIFNIFHRGDCNSIIENYRRKMNQLQNWGDVSTDFAYGAINSADILVSIGTLEGDQIAGKTFDYISAGKPIIYVYYNENDKNLKYFSSYPYALCIHIDGNDYRNHSLSLERFCIDMKGKQIPFNEVEKKYYSATPKFIASQILNKMNEER